MRTSKLTCIESCRHDPCTHKGIDGLLSAIGADDLRQTYEQVHREHERAKSSLGIRQHAKEVESLLRQPSIAPDHASEIIDAGKATEHTTREALDNDQARAAWRRARRAEME